MWVRILLVITTTVAAVVKEVSIENYPWQVSIEKNGVHTCGGTMLRSLVLMTAEHCVYGVQKESLQVRAGTSTREKGGELRGVKTIFEHPDYNPVTFENDVAILELDSAFDSTRPVDLLHSDNSVADDAVGLVIGWGISSAEDGGRSSPNLKMVELPKVSEEKCAEVYPNFNATTMICFGGNGGGDSCLVSIHSLYC
uniref:Peptidase S1 domain-containing protein n=2 Tax=Photinus pyralis TaxID=7054 RepID=A0A1Y1N1V9_PHOPY